MAITRIKNNQITDSTIVASAKTVAKSVTAGLLEDNLTYGSNLTVSGNLTVNGTSTTVNSTTVSVDDPMLVFAPDQSGAGALDLGFIGERGDDTNIAFVWDESADEFIVAFTSDSDSSTTVTVTDYANLHAGGGEFDDNVTIGGTLGVTGAVTLSDDISAVNITASGTLDVTGLSSLDGGIDVNANATIATDGTITGTTLTDGTASISSGALSGATTGAFSSNVTVGGTLGVTGATTVAAITASGLASLDGGIDVDGAFTVADTSGNISTTGTLNVDGASTLNSVTLDASSTFDAGANKLTNLADPTSAQDAATKSYIDTALQAGWVLSDGVTSQTIDISASDTLTVAGTTNEVEVAVSATDTLTIGLPSNVDIAGTFDVTSATTLDSTLDVDGAANFNDTTTSTSNTTGAVIIDGGLGLAENLNMGGNLDVDGTASVTGQADFGAALNVTGLASLDGGIDMDGAFTVADTSGNVSTSGDLNVDGDTTMANVTIDASSTIDAGANKITNVADPTVNQDAATKKYVDDTAASASSLSIAGDTGTDTVTVGTDTFTFSGTANEIVTAVTDNEVTISLPNDVTIGNDLTVTGDLTVQGTTTTVNSTTVTISDPVYTIGDDSVDDNKDRGTEFLYNDGAAKVGFFGYDDSAGVFTALVDATNTAEVFSGTAANVVFGDATLTDTGITGTLDVSGLASLDGGIDVDGAFTVADSTGNVSTTGTLAAANTTITGTLDVSALASLDGGIDVDGAFTVADSSGNVDTSGTLNVDGAATFNGNVTLGDAATDTVTITADISSNMIPGADSTYDIGDNTDRWANIYVDAATVTDNVTVGGTLGVTGETTLASATVSDLTDNRIVIAGTAGSLEDSSDLTFDGTTFEVGTAFDVTASNGNTAVGGTLDVTGVASLDGGIDVDGAFTVADTSGNISTTGTLNVDGASTLNNVTLDASTTFDAGANKLTNLADPTANQDAATKAYVDGVANSGFDITDGTTSSTISGGDTLTFNDVANETVVTVTGDSVEVGLATNVDIAGTFDVTGATTLDSTLDVTGATTFSSNVSLGDSDNLRLGAGNDLTLVHDGTSSSITNTTGILSIDGAASSAIRVNEAGADVDFVVEGDTNSTLFTVDAGTDTVVIGGGTATADASLKIDATDSFMIAAGTTAQRPGTGAQGMMRFNTTNTALEYHDGTAWRNMTADFTVVVADSFSGDGSTTAFTLSNSGTTATTIVSINGVVQIPTTAYGVSGTTLTFTEAPASGDVIDARVMTTTASVTGIDDGTGTATIDANGDGTIDATGNMTITGNLTVTGNTTLGNIAVDAIAKNDTSIAITDTGTDGDIEFTIDGVTIANFTDDGLMPAVDSDGTTGFDLGSPSLQWRDVYVSQGSLYVNGQKVLQDDSGTIVVSADTNQNISVQTSGSGDVELDPTGTGIIQLKGPVQLEAGASFTSSDGNAISFGNQIAADSFTAKTTNSNLTLTGNGTGYIALNDDVQITGNLTVGGTTTTVNSTTLTVADLNITVAQGAANAAAANGAGLTVDGASATLTYVSASDRWAMNKSLATDLVGDVTGNADTATALATARTIGGVSFNGSANINLPGVNTTGNQDTTGNAASATVLATARTIGGVSFNGSANIDLPGVNTAGNQDTTGNAATATVASGVAANSVALGTDTTGNYVAAGATSGNGISGSVGSEGGTFTVTSNATSANTASTIVFRDGSGNFSAGTITGTATTAQYADLAEKYTADADIEPGTVVCFGGDAEVTTCNHDMDTKVAGIVSTNPAHLMNAELEGGVAVALTGRVPCKVVGPVSKGDMMVSAGNGMARAEENPAMGSVIGKALGNNEDGEGIIEVVVGRL